MQIIDVALQRIRQWPEFWREFVEISLQAVTVTPASACDLLEERTDAGLCYARASVRTLNTSSSRSASSALTGTVVTRRARVTANRREQSVRLAGWRLSHPGIPSMPRRLFRESHRLAAHRSFARRCFCVRPVLIRGWAARHSRCFRV